jgi:predicted ATPase
MEAFQLELVELVDSKGDLSSISFMSGDQDVESSKHTIVLGRNGSGKSRLLGDLARSFLILERWARSDDLSKIYVSFPFVRLKYSIGGHHFDIENKEDRIIIRRNQIPCQARDLILPVRCIGLTVAAFDKFPLPRIARSDYLKADQEGNVGAYRYLGVREIGGRVSFTSMLYRAVENFLQNATRWPDVQWDLTPLFDTVGYAPTLQLEYRLRYGTKFAEASRSPEALRDYLSSTSAREISLMTADRLMKSGDVRAEEIHAAIEFIGARYGRRPRVTISFAEGGDLFRDTAQELKTIQFLRRLGLLSLDNVSVFHKKSCSHINMLDASSGELSLVLSFLSLASAIENSSLVLIDEPEISLHPAWQDLYMPLLIQCFAKSVGCHFIVATHSPLVVADLPTESSSLVTLDGVDRSSSDEKLSGESSDFILANAFRVVSDRNYYVRQLIAKALQLISQRDLGSETFRTTIAHLTDLYPFIRDDNPNRVVIEALRKVASDAKP